MTHNGRAEYVDADCVEVDERDVERYDDEPRGDGPGPLPLTSPEHAGIGTGTGSDISLKSPPPADRQSRPRPRPPAVRRSGACSGYRYL